MHGICTLSIVPCRKKPASKSEMVTQLLFGETFQVLEKPKKEWMRIRITHDSYEGWVNRKQVQLLPEAAFQKIKSASLVCTSDLVQVITNISDRSMFPVVIGSLLPSFSGSECSIDKNKYIYEGQTVKATKLNKEGIVETAYLFLNAPYLWGGRSPFGIDCSGFTQIVYRLNGYKLQRDAHQQAEQGEPLSFIEEAEPGNLAFFDNEEGKITHVGIVLEDGMIIHASGKVRIDKLDHHGIYNEEMKKYTHRLRVIKRFLP